MAVKALTTAEAAAALGLSQETVTNYATLGRLRGTKLGRDWRIPAAEVERYKRERKPAGRQPNASAES